MEVKKVAFLVNDPKDAWEGMRSTLGILVENMWAAVFYVDCEIELPDDKTEDDFKEYLEMLDDLEGEIFTNVQANVDKWGYLKYLPVESMITKIKEYELVVPF